MVMEFEQFYDDQEYILGKGLEKFEQEYAKFNQVDHAIGVGNGHDALFIILKCLGIGKGDEVILPAHTFIATALSIQNAGARPVLVDIDPDNLNIKPSAIEKSITKQTKAIVPVHLYGNPCDMEAILELAKNKNLVIIEDNAQAQGASFQHKKTGSIGLMNFTSFYPTKNIGALGDAGMITTNSKQFAEKAKVLRNYGKSMIGNYNLIGINSRMDELQARLLLVKLKYLDKWNHERMEIASIYESALREVDEIQLQSTLVGSNNVRHIFPVLYNKRDELTKFLHSKGIDTLIHYEKPIHLNEAFSFLNHKKSHFPIAEKVCASELSLPIYPGLRKEEVNFICDQIKWFISKN